MEKYTISNADIPGKTVIVMEDAEYEKLANFMYDLMNNYDAEGKVQFDISLTSILTDFIR